MRHEKYDENLRDAQLFEDYACAKLYDAGMVVVPYRSSKWQHLYGESRAGVEIKYDRQVARTGNLFIETEEKTHEDADWKPSGIFGKGVFLCIGDRHHLWLFGFRSLQRWHVSAKAPKETATARGMLMAIDEANDIAEWTDPPRELLK